MIVVPIVVGGGRRKAEVMVDVCVVVNVVAVVTNVPDESHESL